MVKRLLSFLAIGFETRTLPSGRVLRYRLEDKALEAILETPDGSRLIGPLVVEEGSSTGLVDFGVRLTFRDGCATVQEIGESRQFL